MSLEKQQIKSAKKLLRLIINKKINRKCFFLKEFSMYKKNAQVHVVLKFLSKNTKIYSIAFIVKKDGSCRSHISPSKKKTYFKVTDTPNKIYTETEKEILENIVYKNDIQKNLTSEYDLFYEKSLLYMVKKLNERNVTGFQYIQKHSYHKKSLVILKKDTNIQLFHDDLISYKLFKNQGIVEIKKDITLKDLIEKESKI
jgi:hypothetical protein